MAAIGSLYIKDCFKNVGLWWSRFRESVINHEQDRIAREIMLKKCNHNR